MGAGARCHHTQNTSTFTTASNSGWRQKTCLAARTNPRRHGASFSPFLSIEFAHTFLMTYFFSRASLAVSGARCVIMSGESLLESRPFIPANKTAAKAVLRSRERAVLYSCIFIVLYHIHVAMLRYGTTLVHSDALVMIIMILTPPTLA